MTTTMKKTSLSVNVNLVAQVRNRRNLDFPSVARAAGLCLQAGAAGITIHPRPDERHIRVTDVYELKKCVTTEFNIEGFPSPFFIDLVMKVKPTQVTLVPDPPDVLTSNAGWNTIQHQQFLKQVIAILKSKGIRVSIFIDPEPMLMESAKATGTDRIELYTEAYAKNYNTDPQAAIKPYLETANIANQLGLGVNAGHDLNLENLQYFHRIIPNLDEVSIGHALISDALYFGLEKTVGMYLERLR